jgi:hypothetical protein
MANTWSQNSSNSKTLPPNIQNFLESLRSRTGNTPNNEVNSTLTEISHRQETQNKRIEQFQLARQKEWQSVYSAKEKQVAQRIESIQEQLKKLTSQLSKKTAALDRSVLSTVNTPITNPGVYHLDFLDHIKSLLEVIQQDVTDANNWLKSYQQRSQKKDYYWQQADKRGSSFFLNNERTVATSVG